MLWNRKQKNTAHIEEKFKFLTPKEHEIRSQRAEQDLEKGQLPYYIVERLERESSSKKENALPWAATISINELMIAKHLGLNVKGMVMGAAHFRLKQITHTQFTFPETNGYIKYAIAVTEDELIAALTKAYDRLLEEAKLLGADMVVDIKIKEKYNFHEHDVELYGTAVSIKDTALKQRILIDNKKIHGTSLSLTELHTSLQAGLVPNSMYFSVGNVYSHNEYSNYSSFGNMNPNFTNSKQLEAKIEQSAYDHALSKLKDIAPNTDSYKQHALFRKPKIHTFKHEYETNSAMKKQHIIVHGICILMASLLIEFDPNVKPQIINGVVL